MGIYRAIIFAILLTAGPVYATELYVATNGSDRWTGRLPAPNELNTDGPFASLERARNEIRVLQAHGQLVDSATVHVRGGTYSLIKPFMLTAEDSGRETGPIVYRAYKGERVILSGGKEITGCMPYKGKVVQCDVHSLSLNKLVPVIADRVTGKIPPFDLFFDGKRMDLARWPNHISDDARDGKWAYIVSIPEKNSLTRFVYSSDHPMNWSHVEEAQVHIWPGPDWFDQFAGIKAIDVGRHEIILSSPTKYELQPGRRFYVRNVFEELDAPGEWYFDRRTEVVYLYPPTSLSQAKVFASALDSVVIMDKTSYVTFRNFTIEDARGTAVVIRGGTHARVAGCVVRNSGLDGISVNGGTANGIVGNDIYETGRVGISIDGGNRKTLTPAGHLVDNNHIHHFARVLKNFEPGISINGVGNRITHNLISDGPSAGIMLKGNDHLVEFNEVHHVCMESADCGALYSGLDWSFRGNVYRYNIIHDVYGYGFYKMDKDNSRVQYSTPNGARGIYLDDAASGFHVYGNVLYRIGGIMIQIGGGRDNIVENNILVDGRPGILVDARWDAYSWRPNNIRNLAEMPYQSPPWSTRYPELALPMRNYKWPEGNRILHNISVALSLQPKGFVAFQYTIPADATVIDRNLVWNAGGPVLIESVFVQRGNNGVLPWSRWKQEGFDSKSLDADPRFVDPSHDNFQLQNGSPAYSLGFKRIPMEQIGMHEDEWRATWPINKDARKGSLQTVIETYPILERTKVHRPLY